VKRRAAPRRVTVEARAKLNLCLAVGPRRDDGFHDLVTVFQSVSLADTLTVERVARGFSLRVRHESAAVHGRVAREHRDRVPAGRDNLVLRAARLLAAEHGLPGGARFTLTKRIPAQAGMGGGSADAAAALVGLAAVHGLRLSRRVRIDLAARLGSDVPFAVTGGTALGLGRGEVLDPLRLVAPFRAVIAVPDWRVSTAEAFRRHDRARKGLTSWEHNLRFASTVRRRRVVPLALARRGNRFEELLGPHRRDLESLRTRMRAAGLLEPRLTGSGSAVFAFVPQGASVRGILTRFEGDEPLFEVRSVGSGQRLHAPVSR
jgi:4-diphosphocytidyl-2-C-methyl-D-erythritol kinase